MRKIIHYSMLIFFLTGIVSMTVLQTFGNDEPSERYEVYPKVEVMPQYKGGEAAFLAYLARMRYPRIAMEKSLSGKVYVRFIVNIEAKVTKIELAESSGHEILDNAVLEYIQKMPDWESPGIMDGEAVDVQYTVPITFKLN